MQRISTIVGRLALLFFLSYGFLYFSYKWLNPELVNTDFIQYYAMYQHPLHFHLAPAPWTYRQLNAVIVHLLWQVHIYFPNHILWQDARYDQHIFFASLLSNYVALMLAALVTTLVMDDRMGGRGGFISLLSGLLCFFSFHLQTTLVTGQADGWSWVLMAAAYFFYRKQRYLPFVLAILPSLFQREVLPLAFVAFAVADFIQYRRRSSAMRRFSLYAGSVSLLVFVAYIIMRTFVVPVPGFEEQVRLVDQVHNLFHFRLTGDFVFQVFLAQNLLLLLAVGYGMHYVRFRERSRLLLPIALSALTLLLISIGSHITNNAGRMIGLLSPVVCIELAALCIRSEVLRRHPAAVSTSHWMPELLVDGGAEPSAE